VVIAGKQDDHAASGEKFDRRGLLAIFNLPARLDHFSAPVALGKI
jgi:hypothetical protein